MSTYNGSCHCGAINFKAKVAEAKHVLCHCNTCKLTGGGPYSCNQIIPTEDLEITKGKPAVYTYQGASGEFVFLFCS